ncbi:hypothetical protein [Caulobacter sp. 17J65-9]|uniref:hypothetical protein n=1 Tax=Caulobacter sp. 17J65-9 TaxID=2709382 RepID=UPI0013C699E8|nr:hypothetical protein [Caulobacter sp. 17J65-9]NEX91905.1 hypothetical protein [Caulobacter sp. 17J65-9]
MRLAIIACTALACLATAACDAEKPAAGKPAAAAPAPVIGPEQTGGRDLGLTRLVAHWGAPVDVFGKPSQLLSLDATVVNATATPIDKPELDCLVGEGDRVVGVIVPISGMVPAHGSLEVQGVRTGFLGHGRPQVVCGVLRARDPDEAVKTPRKTPVAGAIVAEVAP